MQPDISIVLPLNGIDEIFTAPDVNPFSNSRSGYSRPDRDELCRKAYHSSMAEKATRTRDFPTACRANYSGTGRKHALPLFNDTAPNKLKATVYTARL